LAAGNDRIGEAHQQDGGRVYICVFVVVVGDVFFVSDKFTCMGTKLGQTIWGGLVSGTFLPVGGGNPDVDLGVALLTLEAAHPADAGIHQCDIGDFFGDDVGV
jgi:hypothetical protein